jgi:Pyridoxamine 5'-phosphate oxidase
MLSTTLPEVSRYWVARVRSLLEAPSPAVLTTYRKDGSAHTVLVWFRWVDDAFEVVIAGGDVKLRHLARDPRGVLVVFEAVRPFRGLEVRGWPSWSRATSRRRGRPSRSTTSAWVMASTCRRTAIHARGIDPAHPRQPAGVDLFGGILPR